ncbi:MULTISPECIES: hypothetical protein [Microbacterium]|uniref:Uncharacterized protein n=1 Tax=Microbacterium wangchenii TaxID=2541726 RepID=A0ABX5STU6_9MICO|nr:MULTISPECIES: hypothetical protein [Microbacterium]MCK6067486.1 hypothetical protein [Microbacterium sp. EYE_512]QBR89581.1 hypothetical protein E4K62_13385 [Microbacterium wangchenii]TXK16821.1 hypothetical protein FVP99_09130 [Microbacterium wangchenii]
MRAPHLITAGIIVATALAVPTSAVAAPAPPPAEFLTEGEVELHTATESDDDFDPGTVYWEVQIQWSDGIPAYVATWERSEGTWASVDEVKAHFAAAGAVDTITESRQCQLSRIREIAAGTSSYEEFHALSGVSGEGWQLAPDTWKEINEACAYEYEKDWEWAWERTPSVRDEDTGIATVRIPIDVIGPGEHELFAMSYGFSYEPSADLDELCRIHTWPDGHWASRTCRFEWREPATTTVIVPEPPSAAPTDAPAADAQESSAGLSVTPVLVGAGVGLVVVAGVAVLIVVMRRRTRS